MTTDAERSRAARPGEQPVNKLYPTERVLRPAAAYVIKKSRYARLRELDVWRRVPHRKHGACINAVRAARQSLSKRRYNGYRMIGHGAGIASLLTTTDRSAKFLDSRCLCHRHTRSTVPIARRNRTSRAYTLGGIASCVLGVAVDAVTGHPDTIQHRKIAMWKVWSVGSALRVFSTPRDPFNIIAIKNNSHLEYRSRGNRLQARNDQVTSSMNFRGRPYAAADSQSIPGARSADDEKQCGQDRSRRAPAGEWPARGVRQPSAVRRRQRGAHPPCGRGLSAAHDAAEQAHSHQMNASIYSVLPASRRMQPRDWAVLTLLVALHGAALGVLWVSPPTPAALGAPPVLMAALIASEPPAAAPTQPRSTQPRPVVRKTPAPPLIAAPQPTPAPATLPEPEPEPVAAAPAEPPPSAAPVAAVPAPAPVAEAAPPAPVIPPRFDAAYLDNTAPAYPPQSRRLREQGTVLLRVYVEPSGLPGRVELKQSSGYARRDGVALDTVKRWLFVPARQDTTAVAGWVVVPISFSLRS